MYLLVVQPKIPDNLLNFLERIWNTMAFWKRLCEQLKYCLTCPVVHPKQALYLVEFHNERNLCEVLATRVQLLFSILQQSKESLSTFTLLLVTSTFYTPFWDITIIMQH